MMGCMVGCQFHSKIFIVRPISAVRPSSVTENLRGRYHTIYRGIGTSLNPTPHLRKIPRGGHNFQASQKRLNNNNPIFCP